jgi:hypothetical protein
MRVWGAAPTPDDTQMAIALAESLLERGAVHTEALGRAFAGAHDPRRGYRTGTTEVLRLIRSGVHPHEAARSLFGGHGWQGNGAAMRIAPVAVRYAHEAAALAEAAEASARVTHAHPAAVDAAVAQAVGIAAALRDESPLDAALAVARIAELKERLAASAPLIRSRPTLRTLPPRSGTPRAAASRFRPPSTQRLRINRSRKRSRSRSGAGATRTRSVRWRGRSRAPGPARAPSPHSGWKHSRTGARDEATSRRSPTDWPRRALVDRHQRTRRDVPPRSAMRPLAHAAVVTRWERCVAGRRGQIMASVTDFLETGSAATAAEPSGRV